MVLPGDQRDHGDQRLSECRCAQSAGHSPWPKAGDHGTDDSDGEHPGVHQVEGVALGPDEANGTDHPEQEDCCRECSADGESVC